MRYVQIYDIRQMRCYSNPTAVRVYYALVAGCDYKTKCYRKSKAAMSKELSISISALRYALKQLEREGLISMERSAQGTVVHIHPSVKVGSDDGDHTVEDPLQSLRKNANKIEAALRVKHGSLHVYFEQFLQIQALGNKQWKTERELVSHFTNWYVKAAGKPQLAKRMEAEVKQREQQAYEEEHKEERVKIDPEALKKDWTDKITQARRLAAKGDERAQEWLNNKYTLLAIKKYGL